MEILTISYTYIWNLYPKKYIIVFCQNKCGNKEKKKDRQSSQNMHIKYETAM